MQLKELSVNTAQVLQLNRKLEEQLASANKKQQASTKDCQALRADLKTAHDLTEEANTLLTEQERSASAQVLTKDQCLSLNLTLSTCHAGTRTAFSSS